MNVENKDEAVQLYLDDIIPNRFQPREVFDEKALKELAASIKEHGVIQPIIVRNVNGKYEIIAGERRYKASALAGMTRIPAIIRNLDDKESSKVALLENLQRKNLNPIEEARTYQKILEIDEMTQEELAKTMGKSQSSVANKLRLLSLPDEVQDALLKEQISERHARALLVVPDSKKQNELLKKIIDNKMTVRSLEEEINLLYPKNTDKSIEKSNYATVAPISSTINNIPLTPTTTIEENDDYGKVKIVPPITEQTESNEQYINYGEIDKDKLAMQNNINSRTDYYTATSVNPVDIKTIQENATDIKIPSSEPQAALDSLLNLSVPSLSANNQANLEKSALSESVIQPKNITPRESTTEYFGIPDLKNINFPAVENKNTNNYAAENKNSELSFSMEKNEIDSSFAIKRLNDLVKELELKGIKISIDEMDFGKSYQVIIKIDK